MSTKAQIFQTLLAGVRFEGVVASNYVVYFVTAGTAPSISSLKAVWLDSSKSTQASNPYALDANGQAKLYLDGNYDVIVKTSVGGTIKATWPNVQLGLDALSAFNVDTRDATAGDVNISIVAANDAAATVQVIRKKRSDTSVNAVIITPASGTIDGAASYSLTGASSSVLIIPIADENDYLVI